MLENNQSENRDSFIRWQKITIDQLSFINNLIIGLSSGLLVFEADFVFNNKIYNITLAWLTFISILLFFFSLVFGIIIAFNRLSSFRYTARIARKRQTNDRENIENLRDWTDEIDARTWCLFWWDIGIFIFGFSIFMLTMIIKIFMQ